MKFQRVIMVLLATLLLPGLALAQTTTRATFEVRKDFDDLNTEATVLITLNCNTGLPITQSQTVGISAGEYKDKAIIFVVESFEDGALDCTVSESGVDGYSADFSDCGPNGDGTFVDVADGSENGCNLLNTVDPVEVTVYKDWVIDGLGGNVVDPTYTLTLWCDDQILGGVNCNEKNGYWDECYYAGSYNWYYVLTETGSGDMEDAWYTADVIPNWDGGTSCYVEEQTYDSAIEADDSDCYYNGLEVEVGGAGDTECTVINTIFFEGIPTLSQYGMAIMALLMLGVGFVGFRRFV